MYIYNTYIYTMDYYSAIKRNEIMPFAEIWMDLETITKLHKPDKDKYYITYMQKLKKDTNELNHKTERESQSQKTNLQLPNWGGGGINQEIGIYM